MATFLLVILSIALLFLAGWGPTLLLLDRPQRGSRLVAVPVVGIACYIVLSHFLASFGLTGKTISWICAGIFGALILIVPRQRRLSRPELADSLIPLAICFAGLLIAAWPLLYAGHNSYLAFGNADAAFNLAVYEDLQGNGYAEPPAGSVRFWPNAQFGLIFGVGYLGVLLALLTGAHIVTLHEVISASLVFAAPASVYLFCLLSLKTTIRRATVTMCVSAVSSLVCYTFYLQSIGAMTLIALLPALVGIWSAALESGRGRLLLLSAVVFAGASFGYYACFPVLSLLLGSGAVVALAQRTIGLRRMAQSALVVVGVTLVSFPGLALEILRRTAVEATSSRLQASLDGPEVLLSFAFVLTEQLLPFFWGLSIPPMAWESFFAPPSWGFLLALGTAVLLFVVLVVMLVKPWGGLPLPVRVQVGLLLAVVFYFVVRNNGYGVFKLAAWINPLVFACFASGVLACAVSRSRRLSVGAHWLLIPLVGLNLFWSVRLGAASLDYSSVSGKSMSGFTGADFAGLESVARFVDPKTRILVAIPDPVVQRWAVTYLRRWRLSAIPYLSLSPEEPDSSEELAAAGAAEASYVLTWSGRRNDVISYQHLKPVWQNRKFQLVRRDGAQNLLVTGRGWYRREAVPASQYPWQHGFRWLRSRGELLLLDASGEWLRLRMTMVPGFGNPDPARSVTLSVNGEEFDRIAISGFGSVVSKPFRGRGFLNRLSLSLADNAKPLPRPWGLFNRWVPKDGRRLNIAVSKIELLTEQDFQRLALPSRLDLSQQEAWEAPILTGIYPDGWIAGESRVILQRPADADAIAVHGFVPGIPGRLLPLSLLGWVNGKVLPPAEIRHGGDFTLRMALPPEVRGFERLEIRIRPSKCFAPGGGEHRRLSVRLKRIELVHQATARTASGPAHRAGGGPDSERKARSKRL